MSQPEFGERAFVVSPHQDDAVLSIGNHLRWYDQVEVANIFTRSTAHMVEGLADDVDVVSGMRLAEDAEVARLYDFEFYNGEFLDSEERGVNWDDYWAEIDWQLHDQVLDYLSLVAPEEDDTDIYIPAAFGMHPDHYLASIAGMRLARGLGSRSCFVYADQPYYCSPQPVATSLQQTHYDRTRRIGLPYAEMDKRIMLELYPSQLTPPRVDLVAGLGEEFVWPVDTSADEPNLERHTTETSLFTDEAWIETAAIVRQNEAYDTVSVHAADTDGTSLSLELFIDEHDIDGAQLNFARPVGAGWYDYTNVVGEGEVDANVAESLLEGALAQSDSVWLSGLREDSDLLRAIELRARERGGLLFEGTSSHVVDCNPRGFGAWVDSLGRAERKKIRRHERKAAELARHHNGRVLVEKADRQTIDDFLRLQAMRAEQSEGQLDAFADDNEYTELLTRLAEQGLVSSITVRAENTTVGIMLLAEDQTAWSLAIINQGFDPQYASYGPGVIMQQAAIRYAHDQGFLTVDYLRGDEPYKRAYCNRQLKTYKYVECSDDTMQPAVERYVTSYVE